VTWLDSQPRSQVEGALAVFDNDPDFARGYLNRAGCDRRYALWLVLVDLQVSTLPDRGPRLAWAWHAAYETGWSPRAAAFAAWASTDTHTTPPPPIIRAGHAGVVPR
jgi:hypothetical protein